MRQAGNKKKRLAKWGFQDKGPAQADWKDPILAALEVKDVMEHYGVSFNSNGFAVCPFHSEKTASLSVKNNRFKCFGCGAGGNVIDFVMLYHDMAFKDAMIRLDNDFRLNITSKEMTLAENSKLKQAASNRKRLSAEHELFKEFYISKTDMFRHLQKSLISHSPKNQDPISWHPVFIYAANNAKTLEQWLDDYHDIYSDIKLYEKYKKERRLPYWEML